MTCNIDIASIWLRNSKTVVTNERNNINAIASGTHLKVSINFVLYMYSRYMAKTPTTMTELCI